MRQVLITTVFLTAACGGSFTDKATKTLSTTLSATNAARDQFVSWDKQHQLDIVDDSESKDEAKKRLASYRAKRQKVVQGFTVAYSAIAAAAAAVPLVELGKEPKDNLAALLVQAVEAVRAAMGAYEDIREAFDNDKKAAPASAPAAESASSSTPAPPAAPPAEPSSTPEGEAVNGGSQ